MGIVDEYVVRGVVGGGKGEGVGFGGTRWKRGEAKEGGFWEETTTCRIGGGGVVRVHVWREGHVWGRK